MSFLSNFPSSFCDFLSFLLNSDPDHSPLLLLFLCFQDTIVFLFSFFFLFFRAFFEGPLLMQFPVILLTLSLGLNWLSWYRLGLVPRAWLSKPLCDINESCTSGSSQWILSDCVPPWCSLYNSLWGQTVTVNCSWQVVNQYENKGMGKKVIRQFGGQRKEDPRANLPFDWTVWHKMNMFPFLFVYKNSFFYINRQPKADKGYVLRGHMSTFFLLFDMIKRPLVVPSRDQDMPIMHSVEWITQIADQIPFVNSHQSQTEFTFF